MAVGLAQHLGVHVAVAEADLQVVHALAHRKRPREGRHRASKARLS